MKNFLTAAIAGAFSLVLLNTGLASAATHVVVTPTNTMGWTTADTRPGGAVNYVADSDTPYGDAALELTTDATTTAKAQYMHAANDDLDNVNELSYHTKQISASFPQGTASYQLPVFLNGGTAGFSTLVYEPYQNPAQGPVVPNTWQSWDVDQGLFWSTRTVVCSNGTINGTAGGPASYTLAQIKATCPDAVTIGFGANIGSNNPSYQVRVDGFNYNGTTYDFELVNTPKSKDDCKKDGYKELSDKDGNPFKNQGQCIASVQSSENSSHNQ